MDTMIQQGYSASGIWPAVQRGLKRLIDISVACLVLILFSPLMLLIAVLIKLDSPGRVIYKHVRIGKNGKPFELYKFRSMTEGGDDAGYLNYLKELIESSQNGEKGSPYCKMGDDPRITRVGGFLRRYYLDEVPQLWNVMKGDMSLVGPRPHVQLEVDYYTPDQRRRLTVRPGATGLWQVEGKADCSFNDLITMDLEYIDNWNLGLDLQIILRTLLLMVRGGEGFWTRMNKIVPKRRNKTWKRPLN